MKWKQVDARMYFAMHAFQSGSPIKVYIQGKGIQNILRVVNDIIQCNILDCWIYFLF